MVICFKDKNFSGQIIRNEENNILIQLKPFNKNLFVQIHNGVYHYQNSK